MWFDHSNKDSDLEDLEDLEQVNKMKENNKKKLVWVGLSVIIVLVFALTPLNNLFYSAMDEGNVFTRYDGSQICSVEEVSIMNNIRANCLQENMLLEIDNSYSNIKDDIELIEYTYSPGDSVKVLPNLKNCELTEVEGSWVAYECSDGSSGATNTNKIIPYSPF